MNGIDVALVVLLLVLAVRGSWRGIFRESFGFAGLLVGLVAALRYADAGASWLSSYSWAAELSGPALVGTAFVVTFLVVSVLLNLIGLACDQLFGRGILQVPSRVGGALFALAKGGAVLAFVLLFLQLFPVVPGIDRQIAGSRIARPMVSAAGAALRAGWRDGAAENRPA
jgi:membrane protein required for colicin V production